KNRLAAVAAEQRGNLFVFPRQKAFVGSGQRVIHSRMLVQVALGKKGKNGKRKDPIPFTNAELHAALVRVSTVVSCPTRSHRQSRMSRPRCWTKLARTPRPTPGHTCVPRSAA